jgi:hypothetical protein
MKTKSISNIEKGETILVAAKQLNGGKVSLEFAEIISNPNSGAKGSNPLTQMLNKSDVRFSPKARRAWESGEKSDIEGLFGLDLSSLNEVGDRQELNILNPTVQGIRVRVLLTETVIPTDYQRDNIETQAKRAGKDGDFITHEGMYVFSNTDAVPMEGEPEHTFLKADERQGRKGISANATDESLLEDAYEAAAVEFTDGLNV